MLQTNYVKVTSKHKINTCVYFKDCTQENR
jgi:hypothetical protein